MNKEERIMQQDFPEPLQPNEIPALPDNYEPDSPETPEPEPSQQPEPNDE